MLHNIIIIIVQHRGHQMVDKFYPARRQEKQSKNR